MASVANNHQHQQAIATATGSRPHLLPPSYTHSIQVLHNVAAGAGGLPHGLGLLTTVASLPPKYRSRYLNIKTKCEIPLDLSVKPPSPVPMATAFAELQSEPVAAASPCTSSPTPTPSPSPVTSVVENVPVQEVAQEVIVITEKPITPPQSPVSKRKLSEQSEQSLPPAKLAKSDVSAAAAAAAATTIDATPQKPIKVSDTAPRTGKSTTASARASTSAATTTRNKATRKLKFDEETSSPVSGTIIRPLEDITDGSVQYSNGDIDPKYNIVEITEETKAELAAIKNVIGDYVCRLCRIKFDDAFGLARHRCACIVLLEYRCPECGKQFNCPANLASHRRWHKPKKGESAASGAAGKKENRNTSNQQAPEKQPPSNPKKSGEELAFGCDECGKRFKRAAYLRKHQQTHVKKPQAVLEEQEMEPERQQQQSVVEPTTTTTITGSFQTTVYKSNSSVSSSASSSHSHEDEGVYVVGAASSSHCDYEADYLSDCSSSTSSAGYGRLQIVEHGLTEEESIAAAALTNLRNCASVIQHTTMAHWVSWPANRAS